jgi:Tol biopolymer transport system component
MGDLEARLIPGTEENILGPFFSPDSQSVAYLAGGLDGGGLKRVAISGGQPVLVAARLGAPLGGSWGADGTVLLGQPTGIVRVPAAGGTPELVIPARDGETVYGPQLLPDGDSVLFSVTRGGWNEGQGGEIVVQSLRTGERTSVLQGGSDARYLASGHLVYSAADGLFAVAFDAERQVARGAPVSVVSGVTRSNANTTGAANFGMSQQGALVYLSDYGFGSRQLQWFDRAGAPGAVVGEPAAGLSNLALAPDERRVVFNRVGANQPGLWVADLERNVTSQLVSDGNDGTWSPDGSQVAFDARIGRSLLTVSSGGGEPRLVFEPPDGQAFVEDWHPDAGHLAFVWWQGGVNKGAVVAAAGDQTPVVFDQAGDLDEIHFSPDGKWIAYNANRDNRGWEVYVVPYPPTGERTQISSGGGVQALWRADGRELFYLTLEGTLMSVALNASGRLSPGPPTPLFDTGLTVDPIRDEYAVSRDGKRFLISVPAETEGQTSRPRIVVVQNWISELRRLVPTD